MFACLLCYKVRGLHYFLKLDFTFLIRHKFSLFQNPERELNTLALFRDFLHITIHFLSTYQFYKHVVLYLHKLHSGHRFQRIVYIRRLHPYHPFYQKCNSIEFLLPIPRVEEIQFPHNPRLQLRSIFCSADSPKVPPATSLSWQIFNQFEKNVSDKKQKCLR